MTLVLNDLGGGGVVILKDIISRYFNSVDQNDNLKSYTGCVWGNGGHGRGLVTL